MARRRNRDALAALLRDTARRHHRAFEAEEGADLEWPLWYAGELHGAIDRFLGVSPTRSKIVQ